jgi:hypothetical protein
VLFLSARHYRWTALPLGYVRPWHWSQRAGIAPAMAPPSDAVKPSLAKQDRSPARVPCPRRRRVIGRFTTTSIAYSLIGALQ